MARQNISDIGEFQFINKIKKMTWNSRHKSLIKVPLGDDAAAFTIEKKRPIILLSTDSLLENIHFSLKYASPQQVGYKAVCVNISDIAAMGGIADYILVSISVEKQSPVNMLNQLYKGIIKAANKFNLRIIGGNTSASRSGLIITITIIGSTEEKNIVTRKGAQDKDLIAVTGTLGEAYAGLKILKDKSFSISQYKKYINKHLCPEPRITEARLLAVNNLTTSMIDLSDGLTSDLTHILSDSNIGADLYREKLPISDKTKKIAESFNHDPVDYGLYGGEDYELLFTIPVNKFDQCLDCFKKNSLAPPTIIGKISKSRKKLYIVDKSGKSYPAVKKGFDHFKP